MRISDWSSDVCSSDLRTGEAPGARGISAFVIDADTPGLDIAERIDVMAPHPLAALRFENCRVSADRRLGDAGQGFKIAMMTLDIFRASVAAAAVGFARRALDEAVARVKSRRMRSEEHTSELQSLIRLSYDVFCLKKKRTHQHWTQ